MSLPKTVGAWTRPEAPHTVTAQDIFKYMDGAGELYLAYRFDHLDVYVYASPAQGNILVELYWMQSSDDAFGLFSGDWGGEAIRLAAEWARAPVNRSVPPHRALYGAGVLRIWSDRLYARVRAARESAASRQAALAIGRAVVAGRPAPAPPSLLSAIPPDAGPGRRLRPDRVWFLRSSLVLNSAYFLATQNILELDSSTEAAVAPYSAAQPRRRAAQLILVRYANADDARRALGRFRMVYLPESLRGTAGSGVAAAALVRIENGWIGYQVSGRSLALACECPTRDHARRLIEQAVRSLENLEGPRAE